MKNAYDYRAVARGERIIAGTVFATSRDVAIDTLRSNGLRPISLRWSLNYTLEASVRQTFDQKELALFYETLAAQYENGVLESLISDSTDFIHDKILKVALTTLAQRLAFHGGSLGREMLACGFPSSHCSAVDAATSSGRLPETLRSLAEDCVRNAELGDELRTAMLVPGLAFLAIIGMVWANFVFVAPTMRRLWASMSRMGAKDTGSLLVQYMDFVNWVSEHRLVFSVTYFGAWLILIFVLLSPPVKRTLGKIRFVRELRERSEMLRQWTLWRALYESGETSAVAAGKLVDNCELPASRRSFKELARLLENGVSVPEAVRIARFPTYVQNGVTAAFKRSDGAGNGIAVMNKRLAHDVSMSVRQLKEIIRTVAPLTLGLGVAVMFLLTLLPSFAMFGSLLKHGVGI